MTLGGTNTLARLSAGALNVNADINVSSAGATAAGTVVLAAETDPTLGTLDLSFAPGASLNYLATGVTAANNALGAPLGGLIINGQVYTLVNELSETGSTAPDSGTYDLAAIDHLGDGGDYALVGDLSGVGTTFSTSLVGGSTAFSGAFEGLGHTITGLTIANTSGAVGVDVGLFGFSSGALRNIGLIGGSVTATSVMTSSNGFSEESDPTIGALAGVNAGVIGHAYATGAVSVTGGKGVAGGLVGENLASQNGGSIAYAYATGPVTVGSGKSTSDPGYAGGLVGDNAGRINTAYATGAVIGQADDDVGGLVGYNSSTIGQAYATGAVSAGTGSDIGGLTGYNSGGISQTYATGYVSATAGSTGVVMGGVVGDNTTSSGIAASYFDTSTTNQASGAGGMASAGTVGETTAQLQGAMPTGFDPAVWSTGAGLYPYLTSFFPNGVQAITTTALAADGVTPAAGGQVAFYAGGAQLGVGGTTSVGADGYVYQALAAGSVPAAGAVGDTLALAGTALPSGLSYTDTHTVNGLVTTAPALTANLLSASTQEPSYSGLLRDLSATVGPVNFAAADADVAGANLLIEAAGGFSVDQAISGPGSATINAGGALAVVAPITSTAGAIALSSAAEGAIALNAGVSAAAGTLTLASAGAISQTAALTAATLTGSSTGATSLSAANTFATLGAFTSGAALTVNDAAPLTVSGAVSAAGPLTLSEAGGTLTLNGALTATGPITLQSSADVDLANTVDSTSGGAVLVYADDAAAGAGTVSFASGASIATSGPVTILYNPYSAVTGYADPTTSTTRAVDPFSADISSGGAQTIRMLVDTSAQLQAVSTQLDGLYRLNADIQVGTFTPIGSIVTPFTGLFDGAGRTLSNLTVNETTPTGAGLFGAVGAAGVVQDLTLAGVQVTGAGYVGGVVGDLSGALTQVAVSGSVTGAGGTGGLAGVAEGGSVIGGDTSSAAVFSTSGDDVGGLVGASFGMISNSSASGAVSASSGNHVGGLIGYNSGAVTGDTATGSVQGSGYVGGLIGLNYAGVSGASASGTVNGAEYVGGLVGWNEVTGVISNSSAAGPTTGTATAAANSGDYVGGLVGVNKGEVSNSRSGSSAVSGASLVGGLVGLNQGLVTASTAAAPTTGDLYVGGLVGWNDTGANVSRSFSIGSVSGLPGGQDAGGNDYVGGAVGVNFGSLANIYATGAVSGIKVVGGLVGTNMPGGASVTTSYATGAVTATSGAAGALFGVNAGQVSYVYGFPGLSGQSAASGYLAPNATGDGTLLSAGQEDGSAAYAGFDFSSTWMANPNGPPTLQPDQPSE